MRRRALMTDEAQRIAVRGARGPPDNRPTPWPATATRVSVRSSLRRCLIYALIGLPRQQCGQVAQQRPRICAKLLPAHAVGGIGLLTLWLLSASTSTITRG